MADDIYRKACRDRAVIPYSSVTVDFHSNNMQKFRVKGNQIILEPPDRTELYPLTRMLSGGKSERITIPLGCWFTDRYHVEPFLSELQKNGYQVTKGQFDFSFKEVKEGSWYFHKSRKEPDSKLVIDGDLNLIITDTLCNESAVALVKWFDQNFVK